jgi:phenylacetate-CoA ligase
VLIEEQIRKHLLPIFYKIKGYKRLEYYFELEKRNQSSYQELKELQWIKLKNLLNYCYNNIPYYKFLFDSNNIHPHDIKNEGDFKKIPILTRDIIINNYEGLFDPNIDKNLFWYDKTSGSTGHALKYARTNDEREYAFSLRYRANAWAGWNYYERSAWIVTDARRITQINSLKGKISLLLSGRLLLNTKNITRDKMFEWAEQIKSFKPKVIYGYSSILAEFAEFLIDNNIKLNGIKAVISTAEPLNKRETISKAFNAKVFDQYGASELPCISHECTCGALHLNFDEMFVEFEQISSTSDMQKIIITPLFIKSFPLLRYELGDAAVPIEQKCKCNLPYPVIELKAGRISDNLVTKDGRLLSGVTTGWYVNYITENIRQFQIIQLDYENIQINAVSEANCITNEDEKAIIDYFRKIFQDENLNIKINYVNKITPGTNGKIRTVISKILESSSHGSHSSSYPCHSAGF